MKNQFRQIYMIKRRKYHHDKMYDDNDHLHYKTSTSFVNATNISGIIFIIILILVAAAALAFIIMNQTNIPIIPTEKQQLIEETPVVAESLEITIDDALVEEARGKSKKEPVKPLISTKDDQKYYVAAKLGEEEKALELLVDLADCGQKVMDELARRLEKDKEIKDQDGKDITNNIVILLSKHHRKYIPLAEYHSPNDATVGSNGNKGKIIEICLRSKKDPTEWNHKNSIVRVFLHELAHSADTALRDDGRAGHGPEFEALHAYFLGVAETLGLYSCDEYHKTNRAFCGLHLSEDYCGNELAEASVDFNNFGQL